MKNFLYFLFLMVLGTSASAQNTFNGKELINVTTVSAWNFAARPAGWYRIATIAGGYRGNASFELRENATHSTLRFEVGVNYNDKFGSSLTVTNHSYYGSPVFHKVRVVTNNTYDDVFLEVYVTALNNDNQPFYAYLINPLADGDWTLVSWTNGSIPSGYTAAEFSVNQLFAVGNLIQPDIFGINRNGAIGIGTSNPTAKLAVNGDIRAKEIKVEAANWPDYVFAKDYKLPSLSETEKHIKEKGHLPGIPSAKEVISKGVALGEMNKKLLEKIEELTLHLIEKEKKEADFQRQLDALRKEIKALKGERGRDAN